MTYLLPVDSFAQDCHYAAPVGGLPDGAAAGMQQANWSWKMVRQFMAEHLGVTLSRSSCWNYLRRLGFVWKRPKKRLLKADAGQRETFVASYAGSRQKAEQDGGTIFFIDEAHFRADVEMRNKWVLRGAPALVDSTSPRFGDKKAKKGHLLLRRVPGNRCRGSDARHPKLHPLKPRSLSYNNCGPSTLGRWLSSGTTARLIGAQLSVPTSPPQTSGRAETECG